ncbi:MAG: penicillin-binding protein 2 [Chloroflexota bacterium]
MNDAFLPNDAARSRRPMRFLAFGVAVALVVGALTIRLVFLQIQQAPAYEALAEANRTATAALPSTRGVVYDSAGRPLVRNVPTWSVKIRPADLPYSQREAIVARLAELLELTPAEINLRIESNPGSRFDLARVKNDVPESIARIIAEERLKLPGVEVVVESRRDYIYGPLLSQVIGFTGAIDPGQLADLEAKGYLPDDLVGKAGVESQYETALRGVYGVQEVERDATGRTIHVLQTASEPKPGESLVLSIDLKEQRYAQKALEWGLKAAGVRRGVFAVMNPQSGEILALVSLPTYDDNLFAKGISDKDFQALMQDKDTPFVNHAIAEQYPPGSTYKLVTGTGALADGKLTRTSTVLSKPFVQIGPDKYWDWNHTGWGPLNIIEGFGHSSDTFFYQVSQMLGIERLAYWAKQFGFGAKTGIDLPGEVPGLVPTNQWKQDTFGQGIFPGETLQAGIGQGFDVATPLQVLNAYAALANGGNLYQPQVVREILAADGTVVRGFQRKLIRKLNVKPVHLETMRLAARRVSTIRHTYNVVDMPIVVAGKTGTAEFGVKDKEGRLPFHTWYAGFVSKSGNVTKPDSQLAFVAFVYGANTVGNAATEVAKYYLQLHYGIEKDYRIPSLLVRGNFYGD